MVQPCTCSSAIYSALWVQARLDAFSREVAILKSCRDRNIVLFIGACLDVRLTLNNMLALFLPVLEQQSEVALS